MKDTKLEISQKKVNVNLTPLATNPNTQAIGYDAISKEIGLVPLTGKEVIFEFELGVLPDDATNPEAHYHIAELTVAQVKQLVEVTNSTLTIQSDVFTDAVGKHRHTLTITYNRELHTFTVLSVSPGGAIEHSVTLIGGGIGKEYVDAADEALFQEIESIRENVDEIKTAQDEQLQRLEIIEGVANDVYVKAIDIDNDVTQLEIRVSDLEGNTFDDSNLVHKTGYEAIDGFKVFTDGIAIARNSAAVTHDLTGTRAINVTYRLFSENGSLDLFSRDGDVRLGIGDYNNISPKLLIKNNGKIGIGNTAPTSLVHATSTNGDFRFSTGAGEQTPTISVINTDAGGKAAALIATISGSGFMYDDSGFFMIASEQKANFINNNTGSLFTTRFFINPNGNVGIGTESPTSKLYVAGNITADDAIVSNSYVYAPYFYGDGSGLTNLPDSSPYEAGTFPGSVQKKGSVNLASNYQSAVVAGESSTASGGYSLVAGGYINKVAANGGAIICGRNNNLNNAAPETWGIIAGSIYCTTNAIFCAIINSSYCTIAAGCDNTTLIGCTGLNITSGTNQTYINNVLQVPPASLYNTPSSIRNAVTGSTFTNGEAASVTGTVLGQKFFDTSYRYEAMLADNNTTVIWVRMPKG